jgi:hypothetical protein
MIVVSDTSPINYLILIEFADILPKLFDRILITGSGPSRAGVRRCAGCHKDVSRRRPGLAGSSTVA